jgi:predicted Zn-dependent protease
MSAMPRPPRRRQCAALFACLIAISGCSTRSPLVRQQCYNPDAQLADVLPEFEALRARGCDEATAQGGPSECERLQREIERLAVVCPAHAPTLMANAVIAYEDRRPDAAQQMLDLVLAQPRAYPDAAVLRARIAIEDGNLPFARRLLAQQIRLVPDHAGLHETHAAALYLEGNLPESRVELTMASALGAPRWRIAYHLGLIEETSGRADEAARLYQEAATGNPGWEPAESRLKALRARATGATRSP